MPVDILMGGQYGSEGKGVMSAHLLGTGQYNAVVRVGGPNAGHSFKYNGDTYKMQTIPCGWQYRDLPLFIGRGAVVNPRILKQEIEMIEALGFDLKGRLFVDLNAVCITEEQEAEEGHTKGDLHKRIGSTGEGIGVTRRDRLMRNPMKSDFMWQQDKSFSWYTYPDTAQALNYFARNGTVLIEGTQGQGLSLIHGTWPYVTSHDTSAAQMMADCGLSPRLVNNIIMVFRTFPIRVAGNSGPLWAETNWEHMNRPEELTTVTHKVRRVGKWDPTLAKKSILLNQPTEIALMFVDYLDSQNEGVSQYVLLTPETRVRISEIEKDLGVPIKYIGTGGSEWTVIAL